MAGTKTKRSSSTSARSIKALKINGHSLQDFLPLLPAERCLREAAAKGENCVIDNFIEVRPASATKDNTIRAEFLRYLILGGCEKSPIHVRGVNVIGAVITCRETLNLESTSIDKNFALKSCRIEGKLVLTEAKTRNISLEGCSLISLDAEQVRIEGSLEIGRGFVSANTTRLSGAEISGNLICDGAFFADPNIALIANRTKVSGDVDLENLIAKGTVAMTGAEIGGDFLPQKARFEGTPALQLRNTKIDGTLIWRSLTSANGEVDLSGATCKFLNTDRSSWMRKGKDHKTENHEANANPNEAPKGSGPENFTKLDNFSYEGFTNLSDDCKSSYWVEWLHQQPDDHLAKNFKPRPWEQLAKTLHQMGYEEEARDIRIEKQRLLTRFMAEHEKAGKSGFSLRHWMQVFFRAAIWGPLVDYGYRPGKALLWLAGFIVLGSIVYWHAAMNGVMTPTHPLVFKEARAGGSIPAWCAENWVHFPDESCLSAMPSEYSEFNPVVYAADVAIPVVNLRMEVDWAPRVVYTDGSRDRLGWWVRTWEWILIAAGWILSLLFVSAVGSSIRK